MTYFRSLQKQLLLCLGLLMTLPVFAEPPKTEDKKISYSYCIYFIELEYMGKGGKVQTFQCDEVMESSYEDFYRQIEAANYFVDELNGSSSGAFAPPWSNNSFKHHFYLNPYMYWVEFKRIDKAKK